MPRPFLRAGSVRFFGFSERYEVLLKGQPPAERIFMLQPADHAGFVGHALAEGPRFLRGFPAKAVQHKGGFGVDARGHFGTQTTNGACGCTHFNPVAIGNAKGLGPFLVNP